MFEYSFGRALSIKYNLPLKLDLSFLKRKDMGPNFMYRDYELDLFNIIEDFNISPIKNVYRISEPHYHYSQELINDTSAIDGHLYLDGYWQTPLYFKEIEDVIKNDFEFKNKIENSKEDNIIEMMNKIKSTNSVMINVRRTDYLNGSFHGVMGMDYIKRGEEVIKSKIDDVHFFIFSDDIEWCVDNIKLDNVTFVDHSYKGDRFSYYLQLMILCRHFIIPNSTFAWWAAWLSKSSDKIVISPKNWFADSSINTNDLIPKEWCRI
jgi:hypothetical protein